MALTALTALTAFAGPAAAQQPTRSGGEEGKVRPAAATEGNGAAPKQPTTKARTTPKARATARPARLTPRQRIEAEIKSAAAQVRAAMVVQDTATLAGLWSEDYVFTSLTGETYSKYERLESVMSPMFMVDEAPEVLPSELDVVRLYGNVAVVHSRLAPPGTARSGSRGGRAQLLTVWLRERGAWRTVAAQTTAVTPPVPATSKKK